MPFNKKRVLYMRHSKGNNSRSTSGDDTSANEDNVWDDTLLIEAYDKAVKLAQDEVLKKMSSQKSGTDINKKSHLKSQQHVWKVGDKCRCKYSEDNLYYEADIIDIIEYAGMCIVKYAGYENEEKVQLKDLVTSEGEGARQKQIQQAVAENESVDEVEMESDSKSNTDFRQSIFEDKKRNFGKRKDKPKNKRDRFSSGLSNNIFDLPGLPQSPFNGMIPPPPPPCMFSNLTKDDSESEAMSAMLMSWYMSGYHTGYYQGLKSAKKQ